MGYNDLLDRAELGLVGLALIDNSKVYEVGLSPDMFYDIRCRKVWGFILHAGNPKNPGERILDNEIVDRLSAERPEDSGTWLSFVAEATVNATLDGAEHHDAEIVKREYIRRKLRSITSSAELSARTSDELGGLIQETIEDLESLNSMNFGERANLEEEIDAEIDSAFNNTGKRDGLPDGLGLERIVPGGIPSDKVTVLFGETGTFKTTLKANIIDSFAMSGTGLVLDFSLEDNNELTRRRALSRLSGVPYSKFATREFAPEDLKALKQVNTESFKNVIVIGDVPPTADEIIRTARSYISRGLVAVVVDYVTLLDWGRQSEREMINDAVVKFQRAAKRDKVAYIIVSQVNEEKIHGDPKRTDKRPQLRDLFGSSTIKNACKLAVAVYRPAKYGAPNTKFDKAVYGDLYARDPELYEDIIELVVRKNVLGPSDQSVRVVCNRQTGKMLPYAE